MPDSGPSAVQFTGGSRARQLSASARIRLGFVDRARLAKPIASFQGGSEPGERLLENRDRFFLTCHFPGVMWRHTARGVMPLLTGQVERRGLIGQRVRIRRRGRSVGGSRPTCLCRVFSPPRGKIEPGICTTRLTDAGAGAFYPGLSGPARSRSRCVRRDLSRTARGRDCQSACWQRRRCQVSRLALASMPRGTKVCSVQQLRSSLALGRGAGRYHCPQGLAGNHWINP